MLEKTAQFQAFRTGFLDEMDKIASDDELTDLEKLAFLGRLGTMLGDWATSGGKALRARALEGVHKGRGDVSPEEMVGKLKHRVLQETSGGEGLDWADASRLPFGHQEGAQLERLGALMRANPRLTGGVAAGAPAAAVGLPVAASILGD